MFEFAASICIKKLRNVGFWQGKKEYQFETIIANSVLNYALMHYIINNLIAIIAFGI